MAYNIKEYTCFFDTPAKKQQERVVVNKIMELLNRNKYDNFDEFLKKNGSYQEFLKGNDIDNVIKHFGNTLNEADFTQILENFKKLVNAKGSFDKDEIKTTTIDENRFSSFKGQDKTFYIDNSVGDKSIESQMKELQPQQQQFQTNSESQNTENMMKELEKNKKESLNFVELSQVDKGKLSEDETKLFYAAANFQLEHKSKIKIDLQKAVIVDEEDNIMKIVNENGEYVVRGEQFETTASASKTETSEKKTQKQFLLTPRSDSIYN